MIHAVTIWKERNLPGKKEGTHPFCGTIGELHHENEVRIETILPIYKKSGSYKGFIVCTSLWGTGIWLVSVAEWLVAGRFGNCRWIGWIGNGTRVSETHQEKSLKWVVYVITNWRGEKYRRLPYVVVPEPFLLPQAIRTGADVFITGEIKYHDYFTTRVIFWWQRLVITKANNIQKKFFIP